MITEVTKNSTEIDPFADLTNITDHSVSELRKEDSEKGNSCCEEICFWIKIILILFFAFCISWGGLIYLFYLGFAN